MHAFGLSGLCHFQLRHRCAGSALWVLLRDFAIPPDIFFASRRLQQARGLSAGIWLNPPRGREGSGVRGWRIPGMHPGRQWRLVEKLKEEA